MISVKGKCAADGNYYIDTAVEYYNPDAPARLPASGWTQRQHVR